MTYGSIRIILILAIIFLAGCEQKVAFVSRVTVSPENPTVLVGKTLQLEAIIEDEEGNPLGGKSVVWASDDINKAMISPTGIVTGISAGGPVTVKATCEGKVGTAKITVSNVPVGSISLSEGQKTIEVGETFQIFASLKDESGNPVPGRDVTWSSANAAVVSVSEGGIVTGLSVGGPFEISASCDGKTVSASITVILAAIASMEISPALSLLQPGDYVQYVAILRDVRGAVLTGREISWSSTDSDIAPISASGRLTGQRCGGPVTITATSGGKSETIQLTISRLPRLSYILGSLQGFFDRAIADMQYNLPMNPHLTTQINAKIAMLQSPTLAAEINDGNFYSADSVILMGNKQIPITVLFASENMRAQANKDLAMLKRALPLLETFVGTGYYYNALDDWYGFIIGHHNVGGLEIWMEEKEAYEARTDLARLIHEDILLHELSHTLMGNETLTHFLAVYLYNVIKTNSTDIKSWIYFEKPYTAFSASNADLNAVLDIYQLIGHDAMMRAFKILVAMKPPYGSALSPEARQVFVDQAPEELKNTVAARAAAI